MLTDFGSRKIFIKIVYYGCALSGKTTSLKRVFLELGKEDALDSIETQEGRTLFWDYGTIEIVRGSWKFVLNLWSATGQDFYASTRPTVLQGTDGIVFVADSNINLMNENKHSWNELSIMLSTTQKPVPVIISLNKRDTPNAVEVREFKTLLDINDTIPIIETIALNGVGTMSCFKTLLQKIFKNPS